MTLDEYLSRPGGAPAVRLAEALRVDAAQVRQWRHRHAARMPSPENCAAIERETAGLVTCEELRPHDRWSRIPDKTWPWHKNGRPVLDVSKVAA